MSSTFFGVSLTIAVMHTFMHNGHMTVMQQSGAIPAWDRADRLSKALREGDISVADMADYLGVHRNTVSRYLHGRGAPDRRTLMLWAMKTGVPLEWIEHGTVPGDNGPAGKKLPRLDSNQEPSGYRPRRVRGGPHALPSLVAAA